LVLNAFHIDYSHEMLMDGLFVMGLGTIHVLVIMGINYFLVRRVSDPGRRKILYLTGVLNNAGFMGFPVINQVFGPLGTFYASMLYIPFILLLWTYGISLFFDKITKREIKQMFLNANMIAVYAGLIIFVFSISIPRMGVNLIQSIGSLTTPLSMFIIGARIGRVKLREVFNDKMVYYGSFIRLILAPLLLLIYLVFSDLDPVIKGVCLIYAALPAPAITVVLANQFNIGADFASKMVVVTHLLSLFTIPILFAILEFI